MNYPSLAMLTPHVSCLVILVYAVAVAACASAPISRVKGDAYPGVRSDLVQYARSQLGTPYVWGGASPDGFDCSGLVQYSYGKVGFEVPRTAEGQLAASEPLSLRELKPGDLLFFNTTDEYSHVGIYIGDGMFIHAPSHSKEVTISTLNNAYWSKAFSYAGSFLD
jgi:peptidoglycan DL-endopeptidase CwlO